MQPDMPHTKADMLARIRAAHAQFMRAAEHLSDDQLIAPADDGWSAKDIMAHVSAWEQVLLRAHIGGAAYQDAVDGDEPMPAFDAIDTINEWLHRQSKDTPLATVRVRFDQSYQQVLRTLEQIDETTLLHGYSAAESDEPLIKSIGDNTWGHYDEHTTMLRERA